MNAGSHDAGKDPDWDPVEKRWTGYEKQYQKKLQLQQRAQGQNPTTTTDDEINS